MSEHESQCFVLLGAFAFLLFVSIIWGVISLFGNKGIVAIRHVRILCCLIVIFILFHFFSSMSSFARKEMYEGLSMPFKYLTSEKLNSDSWSDKSNVQTSIILLVLFYITPIVVLLDEIIYHRIKDRISTQKQKDFSS